MTTNSLNIGFIGLGIMGTPMAGHLMKAGHKLFVFTLGPMPEAIAQSSATQCPDAKSVARSADIIITMVPDTPDVADALFGENGVAKGLTRGQGGGRHVVDLAGGNQAVREEDRSAGLRLPRRAGVGRRRGREERRRCRSWSAASPKCFERVKPVFELMGKNITLVGGNGDGQTCKVANQIVVALDHQRGGRRRCCLPPRPVPIRPRCAPALLGGLATSRILDILGERMIKRTFDPGFRIALHQKDLNLALGAATSLGLALPATSNAQQLFSACVAHGGAAWDHSGMVRALEKLSNFEIGQAAA